MPGKPHAQIFSKLEAQEWEDRSALFDTIDKFRELNISKDISLPQLVVVGDQSSGKSSLLEGLTEISFPVASELCTRFATQIVLRREDDDNARVRASIIPGDDARRNEDVQRYLENFEVNMSEAEFGPESFAEILEGASAAMGLPGPGEAMDETASKRFSDDILKIELSGPHHPHLTIVDVPGLFHNTTIHQTDEDRELIRNLILKYIKDPRTIIMAVMDGRNNLANQEVFRMAREADPHGQRTVGIITKCDAVQSGDEHGVIQIAANKIERLHHGWFVVKNRSTREIQDGVTIPQRHLREKEFFKKSPWNRLPYENIGIEKLKTFLGRLLYQHARDEFPKLIEEINKLVRDTENSLQLLGESRTKPAEQRMYLTRIASDYERCVTDCLEAKLREVVGIQSPLKIRTHIVHLNDEFSTRMQYLGHARYFKHTDGSDKMVPEGPHRDARESPEYATRDPRDIYDWIRATYRNSRGPELPILVNSNILVEAFREQAIRWRQISQKHVSDVINIVNQFNMEIFNRVTQDEVVRRRLITHLSEATVAAADNAYRVLDQLVEDECSSILQTVNNDFARNVEAARQERVLVRLGAITLTVSPNGEETRSLDITSVLKAVSLSNEDAAVYDIHDILEAYYSISLKRFTDNVIVQVIESQLLGKNGPIRLLKTEYIAGLEDKELSNIAREDSQVSTKRQDLQSRLKRARSAQAAASMIAF